MMAVKSLFVLFLFGFSTVFGQRIPKDEYLHFVPIKHPPLVRQAPGSAQLALYGDPNSSDYRDLNPVDGIDDRRAENLMEIALHFSPILVQNSFGVPMDFKKFTEHGASYLIYVDEWNLAGASPELMQSYTIDILNYIQYVINKNLVSRKGATLLSPLHPNMTNKIHFRIIKIEIYPNAFMEETIKSINVLFPYQIRAATLAVPLFLKIAFFRVLSSMSI